MTIPIANIYYLLCYAWDRLREGEIVAARHLESHDVSNLFGRVLDGGVRQLLRRGVDRGYVEQRETIPGVRGRIDFGVSVRQLAFHNARAHCVFTELRHNVLQNQIIKSTLRCLAGAEGIDSELRERLLWLYRDLRSVEEVTLSSQAFRLVQLNRNNALYDFLLKVCELAYQSMLIDESSGKYLFRDFIRDERQMPLLFQAFVRNFYGREQSRFRVSARAIDWQDVRGTAEHLQYLPKMHTDVTLESGVRSIVIDTKFYQEALQERFGKVTVRADHLYQLFAYVTNLRESYDNETVVEGILLYPTVKDPIDLTYEVMGHPLRVVSLDLHSSWRSIHDALLALLS